MLIQAEESPLQMSSGLLTFQTDSESNYEITILFKGELLVGF